MIYPVNNAAVRAAATAARVLDRLSIDDVLDTITARTGVTRAQLTQRTRGTHGVAHARLAAYWLLRQRQMSYPEIGRVLERDHTSVMSGLKRVESLRAASPQYAALLDDLLRIITGTPAMGPVRVRVESEEAASA